MTSLVTRRARLRRPPARAAASRLQRNERRTAIALVSPAVGLIVLVAFLPVLYTIYLSLHDATVARTGGFVGLQNFADAATDPEFRVALRNTVVFTVSGAVLLTRSSP